MASLMKRLLSNDAVALTAAASSLISLGEHVAALPLARRAVSIMPLSFAPRYELAQAFQRWYRHSPACAHIRTILQHQHQHPELSQRDIFALLSMHQHSALLSCSFGEASWSAALLVDMVRDSGRGHSGGGGADYIQYVNVWEAEFPDDVIQHMTGVHAARISAAAAAATAGGGAVGDAIIDLSSCSLHTSHHPSCTHPSILFIYSPGFTGDMPTTRLLQVCFETEKDL
jgi:hypothetical protein